MNAAHTALLDRLQRLLEAASSAACSVLAPESSAHLLHVIQRLIAEPHCDRRLRQLGTRCLVLLRPLRLESVGKSLSGVGLDTSLLQLADSFSPTPSRSGRLRVYGFLINELAEHSLRADARVATTALDCLLETMGQIQSEVKTNTKDGIIMFWTILRDEVGTRAPSLVDHLLPVNANRGACSIWANRPTRLAAQLSTFTFGHVDVSDNWLLQVISRLDPVDRVDVWFKSMAPLCMESEQFLACLCPLLLTDCILLDDKGALAVELGRHINTEARRALTALSARSQYSVDRSMLLMWRHVFSLLHFLRSLCFRYASRKRIYSADASAKRPTLNIVTSSFKTLFMSIDCACVSQVALKLQCPFTAIMLLELQGDKLVCGSLGSAAPATLASARSVSVHDASALLVQAYQSIGAEGALGVLGVIQSGSMPWSHSMPLLLSQQSDWTAALQFASSLPDQQLADASGSSAIYMREPLRKLGCYPLLLAEPGASLNGSTLTTDPVSSSSPTSADLSGSEQMFEAAWRTMQWSLSDDGATDQAGPDTDTVAGRSLTRQHWLYSVLRSFCLHRLDEASDRAQLACDLMLHGPGYVSSSEAANSIYQTICDIHCFNDVAQLASEVATAPASSAAAPHLPTSVQSLFSGLQRWCSVFHDSLYLSEPRIAVFNTCLRSLQASSNHSSSSHSQLLSMREHLCRTLCSSGREHDRSDVIFSGIQQLLHMNHSSQIREQGASAQRLSLFISLEQARSLWAQQDPTQSIKLISGALKSALPSSASPQLHPDVVLPAALLACSWADWVQTYRMSKSEDLIRLWNQAKTLLEIPASPADQNALSALRTRVHFRMAEYSDGVHSLLRERIKSVEFQRRWRAKKQREAEIESLRKIQSQLTTVQKRHLVKLEDAVSLDAQELLNTLNSAMTMLKSAMRYYCMAMCLGSSFDALAMYRLFALWIGLYLEDSADPSVTAEIAPFMLGSELNLDGSSRARSARTVSVPVPMAAAGARSQSAPATPHMCVPSFKFLPLMQQIFSRLDLPDQLASSAQNTFNHTLSQLVFRICRDHPYHSAFSLLSLFFEVAENDVRQGRARHASELYQRLLKEQDRVSQVFGDFNQLMACYIRLSADSQLHKLKGGSKIRVDTTPLGALSADTRRRIPVPTREIAIATDCDYWRPGTRPVMIEAFSSEITVSDSGNSHPYIIGCKGSDGLQSKHLLKSGEDLRQDAVMQQVFTLVNTLLRRPGAARDIDNSRPAEPVTGPDGLEAANGKSSSFKSPRHLAIRTYQVVPLTCRSGILAWVDHTISLTEYLVKTDTGAHWRYRDADETDHRSFGAAMKTALQDKFTAASVMLNLPVLQEKFESQLKVFRPVLRYFFHERFPLPADWHRARIDYAQSVAITSFVGYVLGLGDRHAGNLLIDRNTAEIVHIDFGVAFEQGRLLAMPELVPFRLTQNLIDGMGITGVEGVFRHTAEHTLRFLRDHEQLLMTVLDVLIHDPLYNWRLSARRLQELQQEVGAVPAADDDDISTATSAVVMDNVAESEDFDALLVSPPPASKRPVRVAPSGANRAGQRDAAAATPDNTARRSIRASEDVAHTALDRVRLKLRGLEFGDRLSVEGQVTALIEEARSVYNLCQMFPGFSPWL